MPKKRFNALSLFGGCGGLSTGFVKAGFNVVVANENWHEAAVSYRCNHPDTYVTEGDITSQKTQDEICERAKGVDLIEGGPPCQAYSLSGFRDPNDPRGHLFKSYGAIVERIHPKVCVMENVTGILSMKHEGVLVSELIHAMFDRMGYTVEHRVLQSEEYGAPQLRRRVIFIATLGDKIIWPKKTHGEELLPVMTSREAIEELADIEDKLEWWHIRMKHCQDFIDKIKRTSCGQSVTEFSEAFWRLIPDEPAKTVKANNGSVFVHYEKDRCITPRELACLQGFDWGYAFRGSKGDVLKMIGNAVPPPMAYAIALAAKKMIQKSSK